MQLNWIWNVLQLFNTFYHKILTVTIILNQTRVTCGGLKVGNLTWADLKLILQKE